jgi:hypothetical protein
MLSGPIEPKRHDNCEQDYGHTFTSASLGETEIDLMVETRGRRPSPRFFERQPREDIGAALKLK